MGGAERNILTLGEMLRDAAVDVEVWLTSSGERDLTTTLIVVTTAETSRRGIKGLAIISRVAGIRRNIERFRPDCLISFLESSNIPAILAGLRERVPTIVSVRGNPERFNWFYRIMALVLYRFARSVVAPSREVADLLKRTYLLRNTSCIPSMQHTAVLRVVPPAAKSEGPVVAVGRCVHGKRFGDVIAFVERLALDRELIIVGDGPERTALEDIASRSSVRVRFTGSVAHRDVLEIVNRASFLLSMSVTECWPSTICEALVTGTPVIARDCNYGPREMIVDGQNGFLVESVEDAVHRGEIRSALLDPCAYAQLCANARASAATWSKERVQALWMTQLCRRVI
jgi:glycosyltransferase involved in cell wall biosynthesis